MQVYEAGMEGNNRYLEIPEKPLIAVIHRVEGVRHYIDSLCGFRSPILHSSIFGSGVHVRISFSYLEPQTVPPLHPQAQINTSDSDVPPLSVGTG